MMKTGSIHATAAGRKRRLPAAPTKPKAKHFGLGSCCLRPITPRPLTDLKKSREATLECSQTRQCLVAVECNSRPSGTADLPSHPLGQKSNNRCKPGRSSNTVSLGWRPPVATTSLPGAPTSTKTPATPFDIRHFPLSALCVPVAKNLCFIRATRSTFGSLAQSQSKSVQVSPTQSNPVQPGQTMQKTPAVNRAATK